MEKKRCSKCKTEKPATLEFFFKKSGRIGQLISWCKVCMGEAGKRLRKANPAKHYEYVRKCFIRSRYGITPDDYAAMLEAQGGVCAICGGTDLGRGQKFFHIDHDHVTGQVRALLCHRCNVGLGAFGDSPAALVNAARYIAERAAVAARTDTKILPPPDRGWPGALPEIPPA